MRPPEGTDDLRQDRHRDLLGRAGADVQTHRCPDAGQVLLGDARLPEPLEPPTVRASTPQRPDVEGGALQGADQGAAIVAGGLPVPFGRFRRFQIIVGNIIIEAVILPPRTLAVDQMMLNAAAGGDI